MLQCKDYQAYCLTAETYMNFTDASCTGALDIRTGDWSREILECMRIDEEKLPPIAHSGQIMLLMRFFGFGFWQMCWGLRCAIPI